MNRQWIHESNFLSAADADEIYRRMLPAAWPIREDDSSSAILFGLSYKQGGGAKDEIPTIPDFLKALAERVSLSAKMPVNYIQCRRMCPIGEVHPHRDPAGMIVPMLTLGQERTFRVGGTYFPENIPQAQRKVESHKPEEEILMRHGDLITFNGGRTAHSMFPADKDSHFNPNGFEYRISILFRWTTSIMRLMGPNRANWSPRQVQQHESEYRAAQNQQAQPRLF
jgi:hypothetical protein